MKRPSFFLSSTIYDLRDLRGAIKFHLEEQGCQVMASEFNDFDKPVDVHSYEACLRAIDSCDYYVLLIGSRRGGWYDPAKRISITQQEYRYARALSDTGRIRLLNFVRADTWTFRESYKACKRQLRSDGVDETAISASLDKTSPFAEDPAFVTAFIDEVSRNEETKQALKTGSAMPAGNWINIFSGFRDIADTLRTVLPMGLPVDEAAFRQAVRHELGQILSLGLIKHRGTVEAPKHYIDRFDAAFTSPVDLRNEMSHRVPEREWDGLSIAALWLTGRRFPLTVLPDALSSPTFLRFDPTGGGIIETEFFQAIHRLIQEIRAANDAIDRSVHRLIIGYNPKSRYRTPGDTFAVATGDLVTVLHFAYRCSNIIELAAALTEGLDSGNFKWPDLKPWSPIADQEGLIAEEGANKSDIDAFLARRRAI